MKNRNLKALAVLCITLFGSVTPNAVFAKSFEQKAKNLIDDLSNSLKKTIDDLGDDLNAIQSYLNNYHWKGLVQDQASSGPATLKHLRFNGISKAVVVRPGERVHGDVVYKLNKDPCSSLSIYQVVVGIKGIGPQTTLGKDIGMAGGETRVSFDLIAPVEPGIYQVRFRTVEKALESSALKEWKDEKGNEPDATTTIGIIYVKN